MWVCQGFPLEMNLEEGVNNRLSFGWKTEGPGMTDKYSISLHRQSIETGLLTTVQQALFPNHKHTALASYVFNMARSIISGNNKRNKQAVKVTRKS